MSVLNATIPVCISLAVILCLERIVSHKRPKLPLPPGPPRLPILGNLLNWPRGNEWKTLAEWRQKYGGCRRLFLLEDGIHIKVT